MIKKYKFLLIIILLFSSKTLAFSPEIEQEIYIGCYGNSKIYLGAKKAKKYCLCTIGELNKRYSNEEIVLIFKKKPQEIIEATEYASTYCAKNT